MSDITYEKIDEFLSEKLMEFNLYIQEGSGGYYISRRKDNALNGSTFVDRFAQIVEDGNEFRLSMKDQKTGQWDQYRIFENIEDCLEALALNLMNPQANSADKDSETGTVPITDVVFNCWSCGCVLFKVSGLETPISIEWAKGLESIEIMCPNCKKTMLYNLNNEKDRETILSSTARKRVAGEVLELVSSISVYQENTPGSDRKLVRIDFYDLLWRLKDHSNIYGHYLNTITGALERTDNHLHSLPGEINKFNKYPWRRIPPIASREAYNVMEDFINSIDSPEVKAEFENAILGTKPFKSFKIVIQEHPELQDTWTRMENAFYLQRARDWLDTLGFEYELVT